jgi:mevalonate kinase
MIVITLERKIVMQMIYRKIDDVSKELDVSPSTIKKYYLLIEQYGYRFRRTQQGHVIFSDQDVQLFKKLILLKNEPGMTLQKAVEKIMSSITDIAVITNEDYNSYDSHDSHTSNNELSLLATNISQIKDIIQKQNELIQMQQNQISKLMEEQEKSKRMIERNVEERDKLLMQSIREVQELKKLIIESQKKEEEQKKKWWEFWK